MSKAAGQRSSKIANHLAWMLLRYIQEHVLKGMSDSELINRTGISLNTIKAPWWSDVPEIANATSLDIGLVLRDQKGHEVTLWPVENFGAQYSPRKVAGKERPPAEPINPHHRKMIAVPKKQLGS